MAERTTRDAILRMRRVTEEQARRAFLAAKRALRDAEEARRRAAKLVADSEARLAGWLSPAERTQAAGRLADRESFVGSLRRSVEDARGSRRLAAKTFGAAESSYEESRAALETALRAREVAEAHDKQTRATGKRLQARREESSNPTPSGARWRKK